jgi:hypothetical protein
MLPRQRRRTLLLISRRAQIGAVVAVAGSPHPLHATDRRLRSWRLLLWLQGAEHRCGAISDLRQARSRPNQLARDALIRQHPNFVRPLSFVQARRTSSATRARAAG